LVDVIDGGGLVLVAGRPDRQAFYLPSRGSEVV
jgi:hypothetical protein